MTVLKVKRASAGTDPRTGLSWRVLRFQGRELPVGAEIDTRDYPKVTAMPKKWAQLIDQGFFHEIDHAADPELAREVKEHREEFGEPLRPDTRPEPVVPVEQFMSQTERAEMHAVLDKPIGLQCGECGFHAKSEHGLRIHVGRAHKKE